MSQKDNEVLEIEEIPNEHPDKETGRTLYRMPVQGENNYAVIIDTIKYPLLDVSSGGIRISIKAETSIAAKGTISACELILNEETFGGLQGEVVHYSLDDEGSWVCGIKWLNVDRDTEEKIDGMLMYLRKELFKND